MFRENTGKEESQALDSSSKTITLPNGGAAIRGIDEKFAANPVNNTNSMTFQIATSLGLSFINQQLSGAELAQQSALQTLAGNFTRQDVNPRLIGGTLFPHGKPRYYK